MESRSIVYNGSCWKRCYNVLNGKLDAQEAQKLQEEIICSTIFSLVNDIYFMDGTIDEIRLFDAI